MKKIISSILVLIMVFSIFPNEKVKAAELKGIVFTYNMDTNKDLVIDIKDLAQVAKYYNATKTSTNWQGCCDFNNDGIIDLYDLTLISRFVGAKITIQNLLDFVEVGKSYTFPSTIKAQLGDNNFVMLPVKWNLSAADTSKIGVNTYTGVVEGYNKTITLTLNVYFLNQNANINNSGYVYFDGTYVYYSNPINEGKLSRAKIDGSEVTKINDDQALFINILNGWIYYCNYAENGSIYKVKTDGTGRMKLSTDQAQYLNIYNGKLYYLNMNDQSKLYSMNTDGTGKTAIIQDTVVYANFYGQNIYYSNFSNYGEITRTNLDGTSKLALNDEASIFVNAVNNYLYYIKYDDKHIYSLNIDGSNKKLLSSNICSKLTVVGDWIYYIDGSDNDTVHRLKTDGTVDEKLANVKVADINITGDRIFLYDENGYLLSVKLDGTDIQFFGICNTIKNIENLNELTAVGENFVFPDRVLAVMTDGSKISFPITWNTNSIDTSTLGTYTFKGYVTGFNNVISMTVNVVERGSANGNNINGGKIIEKNGWVYFNDVDGKLYKKKSDNTSKTKICDDNASYLNIVGDWIYYNNTSDSKMYKINVDGSGRAVITSDSAKELSVLGEWIFYINSSNNNYLCKIKTDGTNKVVLAASDVKQININSNWVYFINTKDNNTIYKTTTDGMEMCKTQASYKQDMIVYKDKIIADNSIMDLDGNEIRNIGIFGLHSTLNVMEDRMYYTTSEFMDTSYNSGKQLYMIKLDGTDNRKLTDDYLPAGSLNIYVSGGWIYYVNSTDGRTYRIKSDGTNKEVVSSELPVKYVDDFNVSLLLGEKYSLPAQVPAINVQGTKVNAPVIWNVKSVDTSKLGRTAFEGTVSGYDRKIILTINVVDKEVAGNTTGNLSSDAFTAQSGDWILFKNYKMKTDESNKAQITQITQNWFTDLNFVGDWIYYSSDYIYKIKSDGTGLAQVGNDRACSIRVIGDWIYYVNLSDGSKLYKIRCSGLDRAKITDDKVANLTVSDGWVYYKNGSDNYSFYEIKTDGTGRKQLATEMPNSINVLNGWIYYQSGYTTIHKMKLDGTQKTFVANVTQYTNVNVSGDSMYVEKNYKLYRIKLDGSSETVIDSLQPTSINVLGDWIYYRASDGHYYKIKMDGTGKQLLE